MGAPSRWTATRVSGERVRARLTPLPDLLAQLMPLVAGASEEDLRNAMDGTLAARGARVVSMRGCEFVLTANAEAAAAK